MKVVIINSVCGSGSTGRIAADIWAMLKSKGHEAKVAYGIGNAAKVDEADLFRINNKAGYYFHNAVSRITDRAGFYSHLQTLRLIRWIKDEKPDLIHLHNLHGYYINIKDLFSFLGKENIPVVWTLHDCWPFTGHCTHYTHIGCRKWQVGCDHCPLKKEYPKSLFADQSKRNFVQKKQLFTNVKRMEIVTPSNWLAEEVRKSYFKKYNIQCIYNGLDLDVFRPVASNIREKYAISPEKKLVLAVANVWGKQKGLPDLIRLSRILSDEYSLMIVGLTEEQIKTLPSNIIGISRTENTDELVKLYSAADVFVNPSYEETMGLVTAEALACGTPAVTYNQTAVPEIADSSCGIIVQAGDVDGLYRGIIDANNLKNENPRKRAQIFEKKQQYLKYYELYTRLCNVQRKS